MKIPSQPLSFPAKPDDLSKSLTYVIAIAVLVPMFILIPSARGGNPEVMIPFGVVILTLAVLLLFRVKSYTLTPDALKIVRKAGTKSLPRQTLKSASPTSTKDLGFGIRLFGSGGWGGYFGVFYYRHVGKVHVFATDRNKLILLRTTDDRQYLISPEDPVAFLKALRLPQEPVRKE